MIPVNDRFAVTKDDIDLVAWTDANIPPQKGFVGIAAFTFPAGLHGEEKHLYPIGSGVAFAFYSRNYNFRFLLPALEGEQGWEDYRRHVHEHFDRDWCLGQGIRYFYVPESAVDDKSPGLTEAINRGILRLVRPNNHAAIYAIVDDS